MIALGSLWLVIMGASSSLAQSDKAEHVYSVSLAGNRPPCQGERDEEVRCRGTKAKQSSFTVRGNAMLWFEQNQPEPVAFVFIGPLAVEPFAYPSVALGIGLRESADGIILKASYGLQRRSQTIALDVWEQVHLPPHTSFWVRVERTD